MEAAGDQMNPACPVCGCKDSVFFAVAEDIEYFSTEASYQYYQCCRCHVLFIFPAPKDALTTIYPANYYSYQKSDAGLAYAFKKYLDYLFFKKVGSSFRGEDLKVLDIGGGAGGQLDILSRACKIFSKKVIIDLDEGGGFYATGKGYIFFHGRFEDYQTDDRFDLILAINILEHVEDPVSLLQKASTLLTSQGLLVVKTPNHASMDCRLFRNDSWGGYHCPRHWVIFDDMSLLAAAEKAGLQCASLRYTQGAPFWSVNAVNIFRKWGLVRIDRENPVYTHPIFKLCLIIFSLIDYARGFLFKTSQMIILLRRTSP